MLASAGFSIEGRIKTPGWPANVCHDWPAKSQGKNLGLETFPCMICRFGAKRAYNLRSFHPLRRFRVGKRLALLPSPHAVMPAPQADVVAEGVVEIQSARNRLRELGAKGT
jgi:hypothetical protein